MVAVAKIAAWWPSFWRRFVRLDPRVASSARDGQHRVTSSLKPQRRDKAIHRAGDKLPYSPKIHANATLFKIIPSRTRGGDQKFSYPYGKTMLRSNCFPVRAVATYVKLTKNIITTPSFGQFKRIMSSKLLEP
ncbi:hypothetical protein Y032_0002g750 [Ancylostoma ceylanicum]|uniref:Uncharacterized protein n=1 Tax=Ancylostoma ceylanicum TaxID=53326 RepID=A0A016W0H7_9BILA|nr:hypothetical protein Y032_0002g750 [Ancylostoma ceylanicum]